MASFLGVAGGIRKELVKNPNRLEKMGGQVAARKKNMNTCCPFRSRKDHALCLRSCLTSAETGQVQMRTCQSEQEMFSHDLPINEALKRRSWYSTRRRELSANACGNGARIGAAEAIGGHEDGPCIGVIEDIRDVQSGVRGGARGMVILSDLRTEGVIVVEAPGTGAAQREKQVKPT